MNKEVEVDKKEILLANKAVVEDSSGKILFVKRSKNDHFDPLLWELPGGKQEPGEESTHALIREVKEETGLEIKIRFQIFEAEGVVDRGRRRGQGFLFKVFEAFSDSREVRLSEEHDEFTWLFPKDALACLELTREARKILESYTLNFSRQSSTKRN